MDVGDVLLALISFVAGCLFSWWLTAHYDIGSSIRHVESSWQIRRALEAILKSLERQGLLTLAGKQDDGTPDVAIVGEETIPLRKPIVGRRKWWNKGPVTWYLKRRDGRR